MINFISLQNATLDIIQAIQHIELAGLLGYQDIRLRYRRSRLGPFWITISTAIMIAALGFIFGTLLKASFSLFLPFLAVGLILWTFIATIINEGCSVFISAEGMIKQLDLPFFLYILRLFWKNVLILAHNAVLVPIIFYIVGHSLSWSALLVIPAFVLLVLNLLWLVLMLGIFCARYRDMPNLVGSCIRVAFYFTPIMWMPSQFGGGRIAQHILNLNPFFHLIEIVRAPILGAYPTALNWCVAGIALLIGWLAALLLFARCRKRIAYWL